MPNLKDFDLSDTGPTITIGDLVEESTLLNRQVSLLLDELHRLERSCDYYRKKSDAMRVEHVKLCVERTKLTIRCSKLQDDYETLVKTHDRLRLMLVLRDETGR